MVVKRDLIMDESWTELQILTSSREPANLSRSDRVLVLTWTS